MQLTYLCPKHADWVYSHPDQAMHYLLRDELQGSLLYQNGCYSDAIPYLGCAFDIAAILLELGDEDSAPLLRSVKGLSMQLSMAYQALHETRYAEAVSHRAMLLLRAVSQAAAQP
ncbi:hypothetical protein [Alteromonas halophila]|uniref:Uncharacterized protein n=1 Tax=Alteromonas halophila TaxID=516698 RepID=A0A918JJF6_9ALTE|nr:hypothetical protein [Alteromonas halophila]GGW84301.1 hypothetical protein GCM10007391_17520 [Alteromonas halophila]